MPPRKSALLSLLRFDEDLRLQLEHGHPVNNKLPADGLQLNFLSTKIDRLIGVDEVGRGALAGPVVAAAVSLPDLLWQSSLKEQLDRLNDSKKVSANNRNMLSESIIAHAAWAIGEASVAEINAIGITKATELAMRRAIEQITLKLPVLACVVVVDGRKTISDLKGRQIAIVSADAKSACVAAASVIAKVHRDAAIVSLAKDHPEYDWSENKGYPAPTHLQALLKYGRTPHHRYGFGDSTNAPQDVVVAPPLWTSVG